VHVKCRNSGADPVDEASYHAASPQSPKSSSPQCLSGSWSTAFDNLHITAWAQRHRRHRLDRRTGAKLRDNLRPPEPIDRILQTEEASLITHLFFADGTVIMSDRNFAKLLAGGPSLAGMYRQAGTYVGRILACRRSFPRRGRSERGVMSYGVDPADSFRHARSDGPALASRPANEGINERLAMRARIVAFTSRTQTARAFRRIPAWRCRNCRRCRG
jgi:hypothetical protein